MSDSFDQISIGQPISEFGTIPEWTVSGILPPYLGDPRNSGNMAPYPTTLVKLVERFAYTAARRAIMTGFLKYRQELASFGFVAGFQWINGSFLEDIEKLETRDPKDIDIVTFFRRPVSAQGSDDWFNFVSAKPEIFSPLRNKNQFKSDTQFVDLDLRAEEVAELTRFWFGLFSHRRDDQWKGMLTIPLAIGLDDQRALELLTAVDALDSIERGAE